MTAPSRATIAAHETALAALTGSATTTEIAAALEHWQHLETPGFSDDLPDGAYFDGAFLATKRGSELAMTQLHALPPAIHDLWQRLAEEQRISRDRQQLLDEEEVQRRGPGQPPIGKPFPVRLPAWRRAVITRDATDVGVKDAVLVRWLISQAYLQLDRDARESGVPRSELIRDRMRESGHRSD